MNMILNIRVQTPHFLIEEQHDGTFRVRGRYGNENYRSGEFYDLETAIYAVNEAEALLFDADPELLVLAYGEGA